jgi:hypothetical protein
MSYRVKVAYAAAAVLAWQGTRSHRQTGRIASFSYQYRTWARRFAWRMRRHLGIALALQSPDVRKQRKLAP